MKKVLFISPVFFDYYKEIIKELENKNYKVDFIKDSASSSNLFKAISRINKKFVQLPMQKYFKNIVLEQIKSKSYDYVFLIAGMTYSFSENMIRKIKTIQNKAKFIMYQWDGEKNISYVKDIHKYFDKVFSFDRIDCKRNNVYTFLPLFYIKEYEDNDKFNTDFIYDVSYVGTAHPQKYKMINEMSSLLKDKLPNQYIYQYMPSKLKYYYHKLTSKEYKNAKISDFNFDKLTPEKINFIYKNSKCIFDAPQDGQVGLTMRTIESIGARKKIITTNTDIINYDFYCEENILIYDKNWKNNKKFFVTDYKNLSKSVYDKYSLSSWIEEIFKY